MKLTKEQIDEIVAALNGGEMMRSVLSRVFGERVNPFARWIDSPSARLSLAAKFFDAATKVADGCDAGGGLLATTHDHEADRAALKEIVEEIRGMA